MHQAVKIVTQTQENLMINYLTGEKGPSKVPWGSIWSIFIKYLSEQNINVNLHPVLRSIWLLVAFSFHLSICPLPHLLRIKANLSNRVSCFMLYWLIIVILFSNISFKFYSRKSILSITALDFRKLKFLKRGVFG